MRRIFICLLIACLVHVHAKPALSEEQDTLGSTEDAGNREQTHAEDEARTPGEELPLWEAGLGFTVLDFADYRGSDERSQFILPIPYVIYRGEALKIERDRVRGLFFEYERVTAQLSLGGSVPVNSEDNAARQGMPDLDFTVQIGPSLDLRLYQNRDASVTADVRMPVRTVIATDFRHTHNVGWVFTPVINFDFRNTFAGLDWKTGLSAGPVFGDKRYHNYFYGVEPQYATPERPAYVAESGYAGGQVTGTISRRHNRMWIGAFLRWDWVSGAVFEDSPLVRQDDTLTAGLAVVWRLKESNQRVRARD